MLTLGVSTSLDTNGCGFGRRNIVLNPPNPFVSSEVETR